MRALRMFDTVSGRGRRSFLAISLLTAACARPSQMTSGQWIGDMRHPGATERMEVSIDSSGRSAKISLASWRLDKALAGTDWLVANRFTVADINTAECLRYAQSHPTLIGEFPVVKAWLDRCQSRPAFKAMWAARLAEPA